MRKRLVALTTLIFLSVASALPQNSEDSKPETKTVPRYVNIETLSRDERLPKPVRETLKDSAVMVLCFRPNELNKSKENPTGVKLGMYGGGFVIDDHIVATAYHILANQYANGYYVDKEYEGIFVSYDGATVFQAEFLGGDAKKDIAILKISDTDKQKFDKKSAVLKSDYEKELNLPWYAFGFISFKSLVYRKFDDFLGLSDDYEETDEPVTVGILSDNVESGFSGSPILDQNGICRGMLLSGDKVSSTLGRPEDILVVFASVIAENKK
ncbi:MAG: trypsin-like peptidase domain-containing protein [Patescibacteria group bacterium]|nr:S1C family serine protease [Patescibacteria group bacterium]MDE2015448.1 trypsin-like peptidase domain-containing protein [Patescibacteria group bacterium]MDE2226936.1 trypsin-like peptidase domain-containing protein [Patescibacteria group bacterium]